MIRKIALTAAWVVCALLCFLGGYGIATLIRLASLDVAR